jgi:hypothetical protein
MFAFPLAKILNDSDDEKFVYIPVYFGPKSQPELMTLHRDSTEGKQALKIANEYATKLNYNYYQWKGIDEPNKFFHEYTQKLYKLLGNEYTHNKEPASFLVLPPLN